MSSTTALTTFQFDDNPLRVVTLDGNPWFVGSELAATLFGTSIGKAKVYGRLDASEKTMIPRGDLGMGFGRPMVLVSESGLYKLVMRSDSPRAKPFQNWVTKVVLPAIRKDGGYILGEEKVATGELAEAEFLLKAMQMLMGKVERLRTDNLALEADKVKLLDTVKVLEPKAAVLDTFVDFGDDKGVRETAKLLGLAEKAFVARMIELGVLYRLGKDEVLVPHATHVKNGNCVVRWAEHSGKMRPTALFTAKCVKNLAKRIVATTSLH